MLYHVESDTITDMRNFLSYFHFPITGKHFVGYVGIRLHSDVLHGRPCWWHSAFLPQAMQLGKESCGKVCLRQKSTRRKIQTHDHGHYLRCSNPIDLVPDNRVFLLWRILMFMT